MPTLIVAATVGMTLAYLTQDHTNAGAASGGTPLATNSIPQWAIQHGDSAPPSDAELRAIDPNQLRAYLLAFQRITFVDWNAGKFLEVKNRDEYDYEDPQNWDRLHRQLVRLRPAEHRYVKAMAALRPPPQLADEHAIMVRDARAVSAAWDGWIKVIEDSDVQAGGEADLDVQDAQGQQSADNREWMKIMVAACRAAGIKEPRLVRRRLLV